MRLTALLALTLTFACTPKPEQVDFDGDGFTADVDCHDGDAAVNSGATEACNGVDDNCDGVADEAGAEGELTFYADADGDGHGDLNAPVTACEAPAAHVTPSDDCDDADPAFHPGANEDDCTNPADYNCDGSSGFDDVDQDDVPACIDCDDSNSEIYPGAPEHCDNVDEDCDGDKDELAVDAPTWNADADGDAFGGPIEIDACKAPEGFVGNALDCDDLDPQAWPGALETCDEGDDDCDGEVDEEAYDAQLYYADNDADGYGDPDGDTEEACTPSAGYVADVTDCDDSDRGVHPFATETCDGEDDDCDGQTDEAGAKGESTWYLDADGDGYGGDMSETSCDAPDSYVSSSDDCDDLDAASNPAGSEVCDGADNDCDGTVDDDASDTITWYADTDEDGAGDPDTTKVACDQPSGYVENDLDCEPDDADAIDCVWNGPVDFTPCSGTGRTGPSQANCDTQYAGTEIEDMVTVSSGIQQWTVPVSGTYAITAYGAQGKSADASYVGGKGAKIYGEFDLDEGDVLYIIPGQIGTQVGCNGGGGGGSFVVDASDTSLPLIAAGGGGGTRESVSQNGCDARVDGYGTTASGSGTTHTCAAKSSASGYGGIVSSTSWGSAGAGFLGDGAYESYAASAAKSFASGMYGGDGGTTGCSTYDSEGGFGGGGSGNGCCGGGGGGGYSGGDGGRVAGGGGSYNAGSNASSTAGANSGDGKITIERL